MTTHPSPRRKFAMIVTAAAVSWMAVVGAAVTVSAIVNLVKGIV